MSYAIIGFGAVGQALARAFARAGIEVAVASTRPPESIAAAAVEALGRSLAIEFGPIRVNTIRPGYVETDLWAFLSEADAASVREKVREKFPVHRLGTPADVGHAAVFLMTNPHVTGAVVECPAASSRSTGLSEHGRARRTEGRAMHLGHGETRRFDVPRIERSAAA